MIKKDHCDCGFNAHTTIGFSDDYDHGYCTKCGNIFTFHWNGCNPLSENKTCPKCGAFDEVETENFIEQHINMIKMFRSSNFLTEKGRKEAPKQINELNRIRREFDKYKEEREIRLDRERKQREEDHKRNRNKQ